MSITVHQGDALEVLRTLPAECFACCVTSPPYYGLRDYGVAGQIGLEETPEAYVAKLVEVFREVRRTLRDDGVLFLNLGDSYAANGKSGLNEGWADRAAEYRGGGHRAEPSRERSKKTVPPGLKPKDLIGIPWMVAFALRADGWFLRSDIIWSKPNPMPESVRDRPTKAHEYMFLLSKSERYFWDAEAVAEPVTESSVARLSQARLAEQAGSMRVPGKTNGPMKAVGTTETRNCRSVWTIATQPFSDWTETVRRVRVEEDAPHDGKKRTTSPDCPIHGDSPVRPPMASCGGHEGHEPFRNADIESRPAQEQEGDSAPTDQNLAREIGGGNSGCLFHDTALSATGHSIGTNRTGRDLETTPSCSASARIPSDTEHTSGGRGPSGSAERKHDCNTDLAGSADRPSEGMIRHTAGTSSFHTPIRCTCEWYVEIVEKTSHFATFPPELAERCIKAGCPAGSTVLDPFGGAGTVGLVADRLQRSAVLVELNPEYAEMARRRIRGDASLFAEVA